MTMLPAKNGLVGLGADVRKWSPQRLMQPVLETLSAPVRKRVEQSVRILLSRAREYEELAGEHDAKQREYDGNERILMALPGGANARSFEATEMRRRQDGLDTELQGIETRLAGLARLLGWLS